MSTPAVVWLLVGAAGTALLAIVLVALVRQGMLLGRTAMRFGREVGDLGATISAGRERGTRR